MYTVLITGGHTGLGLECSRYLLAHFPAAHLVWASRSVGPATATARQLSLQGRVQVRPLDLASLGGVRALAATVQAELAAGALPPLQALVCNAGIQFAEGLHRTAEGIEETFGVNHLGHFLLVELLLPHLNPAGRVVVVSSGTHFDAPRVDQRPVWDAGPAVPGGAGPGPRRGAGRHGTGRRAGQSVSLRHFQAVQPAFHL